MAAIFDLPLTSISDSVHTSPAELLDPENVGVAFKISLLPSVEAEKLRCFILLPVFGGHLRFATNADIAQYLHEFSCVPRPLKCRFGWGIPVCTLYRS